MLKPKKKNQYLFLFIIFIYISSDNSIIKDCKIAFNIKPKIILISLKFFKVLNSTTN